MPDVAALLSQETEGSAALLSASSTEAMLTRAHNSTRPLVERMADPLLDFRGAGNRVERAGSFPDFWWVEMLLKIMKTPPHQRKG